jgi:hypothetical protein
MTNDDDWNRWADTKINKALNVERKNVDIMRDNDKRVLDLIVEKLIDRIDKQAERISKQDLELKVLKQILLSRKRNDKHERRAVSQRRSLSPPS